MIGWRVAKSFNGGLGAYGSRILRILSFKSTSHTWNHCLICGKSLGSAVRVCMCIPNKEESKTKSISTSVLMSVSTCNKPSQNQKHLQPQALLAAVRVEAFLKPAVRECESRNAPQP